MEGEAGAVFGRKQYVMRSRLATGRSCLMEEQEEVDQRALVSEFMCLRVEVNYGCFSWIPLL